MMTANDEAVMNQTDTAKMIAAHLRAMFPTAGVMARVVNLVTPTIAVQFTSGEPWPYGIAQNDHCFFRVIINGKEGAYYIENDQIGRADKVVKMRKISGKTEYDCAVKLIAWFKKNADAINAARNIR